MPTRRAALLAAPLLAAARVARAQGPASPWPSRPITILVPFAPGSLPDGNARFMAQRLSPRLGQPVVIENKGGAGGNIGTEAAARARPDGHTILFGTQGTHAANRWLYGSLPYDPQRDFIPIHALFADFNVMVVGRDSPYRDVAALVAAAKAQPGRLTYASGGIGTGVHLAGAMFARVAGIELTHVPYRGTPAALADLAAGRADVMFDYAVTSVPLIQGGQARALAVTGKERLGALPAVPTVAEIGLAEAGTMVWSGLFLPAGTPAPIAARLAAETEAVLAEEEARRWADRTDSTLLRGLALERFADFIATETERWRMIVAVSGARLE